MLHKSIHIGLDYIRLQDGPSTKQVATPAFNCPVSSALFSNIYGQHIIAGDPGNGEYIWITSNEELYSHWDKIKAYLNLPAYAKIVLVDRVGHI